MTDDDHLLENQQFWIVYTEAKESLGCSQYLFIPNDIEVMKPTWMYNLKHFPRPKSLKIERNSSSLEEKVTGTGHGRIIYKGNEIVSILKFGRLFLGEKACDLRYSNSPSVDQVGCATPASITHTRPYHEGSHVTLP